MFKENSKAIYLQIADRILDDILCKRILPGDKLPSVREYAAYMQVNPNTVMRTYDHLASLDIIFNKRGIGYFLSEEADKLASSVRREQLMDNELFEIFRQLDILGFTSDDLKQEYENYLIRDKFIKKNK